MEQRTYRNRMEAGQALAPLLKDYAGRKDVVVLGLPRGGIPVAFEVARALHAPLDAFLVGKIGFPGQPELALGAVTSGGVRVINPELLKAAALSEQELETLARRQLAVLERKESDFRRGLSPVSVDDRTVILVDDGAATGASMRAAILGLHRRNAAGIVAALPVASRQAMADILKVADEIVCPSTPEPFQAVGLWYADFSQVPDEEVAERLKEARTWLPRNRDAEKPTAKTAARRAGPEVRIPAGTASLAADLAIPSEPKGLVIFSHGSGSSRRSPRNIRVAESLNAAGFATLLMDLLTPEEEMADRKTGEFRFDVGLLSGRLAAATRWISGNPDLSHLGIGYFGASTGAAAALIAASRLPEQVSAVVSRGGRPDLAGSNLGEVDAPTLLIVGGADKVVLELNREAMDALRCEKRLEVVPGATHLFEEPGALEKAASLATDWFAAHLPMGTAAARPHRERS